MTFTKTQFEILYQYGDDISYINNIVESGEIKKTLMKLYLEQDCDTQRGGSVKPHKKTKNNNNNKNRRPSKKKNQIRFLIFLLIFVFFRET